jgi:hypothetical protein
MGATKNDYITQQQAQEPQEEPYVDKTEILDFDYFRASTIKCAYDMGEHDQIPVYQQCEHCYMVKNVITPLCNPCGYHINGIKVCNMCYLELDEKRENEFLNE